jgi:peptidoglycan/LPS O-acetylase OafA/YrhL
MASWVKFIITLIIVIGFALISYHAVDRKFKYEKFDDNINDLEAILRVEKKCAKCLEN